MAPCCAPCVLKTSSQAAELRNGMNDLAGLLQIVFEGTRRINYIIMQLILPVSLAACRHPEQDMPGIFCMPDTFSCFKYPEGLQLVEPSAVLPRLCCPV